MVAIKRLTAILIIIGGVYFGATTNNARTVNTVANNRGNIYPHTVHSMGTVSTSREILQKNSSKDSPQSNQLLYTVNIPENSVKQAHVSRGQAETRELIGELEITAYSEHSPVASDGSMSGPGKVAVDPIYILYGTKLMIEGYGEAIAADSGRLIKGITPGQKIWNPKLRKYERLANVDVWFSTKAEALKWGRRVVKVYRLE